MRAALAAALLVATLPAPAHAQTATGVIAYTRGDTVYVARPDGTGERAYTTGLAPALARDDNLIAYAVRAGGATRLMVARLDDPGPAREVTVVPEPDVAAFWSPSRTRLALRLRDGLTTTLATVNADGTGLRRYDLGRLLGRILWRDDDTIVVGTDEGLRMVTYGREARPVPGTQRGDAPFGWETDDILYVNDAEGGIDVVFVDSGGRAGLQRPAVGWGTLPSRGLVFTTGTVVEIKVRTDSEHYADLPPGAPLLDLVTDREPMLAELAGGDPGIYSVLPAEVRRIATGTGVTLSLAASYDAVAFPPSADVDVWPALLVLLAAAAVAVRARASSG